MIQSDIYSQHGTLECRQTPHTYRRSSRQRYIWQTEAVWASYMATTASIHVGAGIQIVNVRAVMTLHSALPVHPTHLISLPPRLSSPPPPPRPTSTHTHTHTTHTHTHTHTHTTQLAVCGITSVFDVYYFSWFVTHLAWLALTSRPPSLSQW